MPTAGPSPSTCRAPVRWVRPTPPPACPSRPATRPYGGSRRWPARRSGQRCWRTSAASDRWWRVPAGYREPVLVSSTDGVGTKLLVAEAAGRYDTIGIDLVAMCVDDIAVQGADPLFFLDYVAIDRVDPSLVEALVAGMAEGCRTGRVRARRRGGGRARCRPSAGAGRLRGGRRRTAEILTGALVRPGDVLLGLPSDGLRSNGYSLARRVLRAEDPARLDGPAWPGAAHSLADELLRPSIVYAPAMAARAAGRPRARLRPHHGRRAAGQPAPASCRRAAAP